jgi:hypothetical protein
MQIPKLINVTEAINIIDFVLDHEDHYTWVIKPELIKEKLVRNTNFSDYTISYNDAVRILVKAEGTKLTPDYHRSFSKIKDLWKKTYLN